MKELIQNIALPCDTAMMEIHCSGLPYEIGFQHGRAARSKIENSLVFYKAFFKLKTGMDWTTTALTARKFMPLLEADWPHFVDEMRGIADGAQLPFESILALNVRTEISMGMMTDGCTSLAWTMPGASYMAQNWDWEPVQQANLVVLHIKRGGTEAVPSRHLPSICQVTEAGIIGKIGINSAGVGVCLNAIRVRGVDFTRLPGHLALRAVLDSTSRADALATLRRARVAAAIHILVADQTGATSIEASARDLVIHDHHNDANGNGAAGLVHSNHFLHPHADGVPLMVIPDESVQRVHRIAALLDNVDNVVGLGSSSAEAFPVMERILEDENNGPFGINKAGTEAEPLRTLFSIVMSLDEKKAAVRFGRPTADSERIALDPVSL